MKRYMLFILGCFLFAACTPSPESVGVVTMAITRPVLTPTSPLPLTATPTIPLPTATVTRPADPTQTATPRPTPTITPTPEPTEDRFLTDNFEPQP